MQHSKVKKPLGVTIHLYIMKLPSHEQAVKHLHDHDLIHLDIKLENILVALNGRYKLGDFGLVVDVSKVCFIHGV
jgi:serine/threonine protein kinase